MKNLKILVVLISLIFSVGNILQAQDAKCFDMFETKIDGVNTTRFNLTIINQESYPLIVKDDLGLHYEICLGNETCYYSWEYQKDCTETKVTIMCFVWGPCKSDSCAVIVDAKDSGCDD